MHMRRISTPERHNGSLPLFLVLEYLEKKLPTKLDDRVTLVKPMPRSELADASRSKRMAGRYLERVSAKF
jgi:hypothetical protein